MPGNATRAAPGTRTARHDQVPGKVTDPRSSSTVPDGTSAIRAAAMRAAERGWWVFPTRPGGKEPRPGLSWPQAATGDPARLARATWRPGENYGIAAKPSGLVIIDLDCPKPGYELPPEWRGESGVIDGRDVLTVLTERCGATSWPHTFAVSTPSGGLHLYYVAPPGRPIGNKPLGPLIDVRGGGDGNGGYVLGPGSILNGRAYEIVDDAEPQPLPAWIADLLDPPRRGPVTSPRPVDGPRGDRVAARLDGLMAAVADANPGERNNTLHWAACRAAEMIAAGQLTADQVHDSLGWAAGRAGLDDGEAWRTIASALRQPLRRTA
jgi:hypothetical protein